MVNLENQFSLLELIKAALWGKKASSLVVTNDMLEEFTHHAIIPLPMPCLANTIISTELLEKWKIKALQQIAYYYKYIHYLSLIPLTVSYVILKGTSAAQYYPNPEYRTMGDIDIMTKREDYNRACIDLLGNGFIEQTSQKEAKYGRHRSFAKNGIIVEIHSFFAEVDDPLKAQYLDDLIISHINPSHMLPDLINGLVILEHISQHLENGLGLRQIIDWMMFVNQCLPEEKWEEFECMAGKIGLKNLAIISTRMCELYLGLSEHAWCSKADETICSQLMNYVLSCGNFGNKKVTDEAISENAFAYASTPRMAIQLLQQRGLVNWKATNKYGFLRPFAWIYQAIRYANKGLGRKSATSKLKAEYKAAMERKAMFNALGVRTAAKGTVVYKEGKYIKT